MYNRLKIWNYYIILYYYTQILGTIIGVINHFYSGIVETLAVFQLEE
jgi:hypothetical protein